MARSLFGGTEDDYTASLWAFGGRKVLTLPGGATTITVWDAAEGGTQVTDLTADEAGTTPLGPLVTDADGFIPAFYGPDATTELWGQVDGASRRFLLYARGRQGPAGPAGPEGPPGADGAPGGSDAATAGWIETPGSLTETALKATIAAREAAPKLYYLDAYETFFPDASYVWQAGQGTVATTASAAAATGATTLSVADATGLSVGVVIVTGAGTAQMQMRKIAGVAGTTLTLDTALTYPVASAAVVSPLWTNDRHLTAEGWKAFAYFIANARDADGNYVITGTTPKVTYLGDSWIANGGTAYADALQARIPGATGINAGVGGDESDLLLARFDTDVPADSDYVVVNEPGVNDDTASYPFATQAQNLEALWRKARGIGATLIYTGHVPIQPAPATAAARHVAFDGLLGDGSSFPAVTPAGSAQLLPVSMSEPNATSLGIGDGALGATPSGAGNLGIGYNAGAALTSGQFHTLIGYAAGSAMTTGNYTVMIGTLAGRYTTGDRHVLIGYNANTEAVAGSLNTVIGYEAGHLARGSLANKTTGANGQTIIGAQAGGNANYIVAVGYNALASATYALAAGSGATAAHAGAVAIGCDSGGVGAASAAANEFVLGTVNHRLRVPGLPTTAPAAGSGILWNDGGTVRVA